MKQAILNLLPEEHPWQESILWFASTDSTNTQAKAMAAHGATHGTVLIAGHQTGGRGRLGRSFHSPEGKGLYLSVILRPNCPPDKLMHLTCAAGIAACDAVEDITHHRPGIKWINDLVVQKKKLGGILTEMAIDPKSGLVDYAVIGIGINCNHEAADFPPELQEIATSAAMVTGSTCNIAALAAALIIHLEHMDRKLLKQQAEIMDHYRMDCITPGNRIVAIRGEEKRYAQAESVLDDGSLLVTFDDGTTEAISSGEVSIRGMYGFT